MVQVEAEGLGDWELPICAACQIVANKYLTKKYHGTAR